MNKKPLWPWFIGLVVLLFAALYTFKTNNPAPKPPHDDIPCIEEGVPLTQHLHPEISITVDGEPETIPATVGYFDGCEKDLHMHDDNLNVIHVETQTNTTYTLGDFFRVWGAPIDRAGYVLKTTVNGATVENAAAIRLTDPQRIEMQYTLETK